MNNNQNDQFFNRFREAREIAGLSLAQAAKHLGIRTIELIEIELGKQMVNSEQIKELAAFYEVNPDWLSGETTVVLTMFGDQWQVAPRDLEKLPPEELPKLLQVLAAIK